MRSIRPLFTITVLAAVFAYLYVKINEAPVRPAPARRLKPRTAAFPRSPRPPAVRHSPKIAPLPPGHLPIPRPHRLPLLQRLRRQSRAQHQ